MSQQLKANQAAFDIGQMAHRMFEGYYMHLAAIQVAKDPRAVALSPNVEPGQMGPIGRIRHKDGTRHEFSFAHYLAQARTNPAMVADLDRLWLVGALLTIGDAKISVFGFDRSRRHALGRTLKRTVPAPLRLLCISSDQRCATVCRP